MTYQQEKLSRIKRKVTNIVFHNYSLNPTNTKMNEQATVMILKKNYLTFALGFGTYPT
jgi:hypothetical protein